MITLHPDMMIGKGLHRECFVHPDNNNLCIKVVTNGNQQETQREQSYYNLLDKKNITWDMLPKFHGNIKTNMGSGAVFDLIRDHDNNTAKTLGHYLKDEELLQENYDYILSALQELKHYLISQNIITMSIKPKNLLFQKQKDGQGKVYIVDNIGNSDLIAISSYSYYFGKKKILRKWINFKNFLIKHYPNNTLVHDLTQKI